MLYPKSDSQGTSICDTYSKWFNSYPIRFEMRRMNLTVLGRWFVLCC